MASSTARPAYGQRLMPAVLDELAQKTPDRLYAAIPKTLDVTDGFRDLSVADIARCVNFMAKWIEDRFGRSNDFETLSFIGIPDLRGAVIFQAAVKTGYKLLLPSPRNPATTNLSLMNQTGSTKLLHAKEVAPIVKPLKELEPSISLEEVPSFEDMMNSSPEHYPYDKTFSQSQDEPVIVLHSSGSTGLPKPITMTHASFAVLDNEHNLPEVPGRKKRDWSMWTFDGEARVYTVFPFFHLAGFLMLTLQTIFMNASPVLGPPHLIPDGPLLKAVMERQKLRSIFLPPAVIEQLLHEPNGIDFFKDLDFLVYSGAPFNPVSGDKLSKVVELISPFGSTEIYPQPELAPSREDWAWHEFNPHVKHEMQLYDASEGTYELVIIVDESTRTTAAAYHNLPGLSEYRTKDLFTQHPEKPQLYKYYGRRDDIIVLANGEKFNPIPAEVNIQNSPSLKGAFLIGNSRTQSLLLVEPKEPLEEEATRTKLVEDLWPLIEESNALIAGQGRVHRGKVLCAVPTKPFTRTGKGTIVRKLTEEAYKDEIEALYSSSKTVTVTMKPTSTRAVYDAQTVTDFLRSILAASFPAASNIPETDDFFAHGLDSIQTLEIISNLKRNLASLAPEKSTAWISPRTLFHNPTIAELTTLIRTFLNSDDAAVVPTSSSPAQAINKAVSHYASLLPPAPSTPRSSSSAPITTIAVLGSTGYLGTHLLRTLLLQTPSIERIYCLDRSDNAKSRVEASLRVIGGEAAVEQANKKVSFLTAALGSPRLGLSDKDYAALAAEVDVFIYNSWRLDFGLAVRSFDPLLKGVVDVVGLAATSAKGMRVLFVSSMSSVGGVEKGVVVPEAPAAAEGEVSAPLDFGYAHSKMVAERVLGIAAGRSGVEVDVVRVGQIGGAGDAVASGKAALKWTDQPWLSAIVRTARETGSMPLGVSSVDWMPVDTVAEMLRDFSLLRPASVGEKQPRVYHITHPKPLPWQVLVDLVREMPGGKRPLETVPLREWAKKLRAVQDPSGEDASKMPALTMLDFYENLGDGLENISYSTEKAQRDSSAQVPPLDKELMAAWLQGWDLN